MPRPLSRRNFLRQTAISGMALTIGAYLPAGGERKAAIVNLGSIDGVNQEVELLSWISIDSAGRVLIFNHRSEMGQGTFQAIPQIIAEELEVGTDQMTIRFAAANPKKWGPQPQEGSFSVRGWYKQLLQIGASAREMLIETAAKKWNVPVGECYAERGEVIHRPSGNRLGYGVLVEAASKLTPPKEVKLKERKDYKIVGKPMPRQDTPIKINGSAGFGLDKKLPGMLYAQVERNPRFRGKVKSFDASATLAVPGVKRVFKVQRVVFTHLYEGVAVVADSLWAAMRGRRLLKVEWNDQGFEHLSSEQLLTRMHEDLKKPQPSPEFEKAYGQAEKKIEVFYETPYQSHSCMEPLNCIADVREDRIEMWGPLQEANWIQADLSERMKMPIQQVSVNMTFLGGGFGRKAFLDYPYEAALISKEMRAPVQVMWTREDDMTGGPFRPGAVYVCRGGLDKEGRILASQVLTASQPIGEEVDVDRAPVAASTNSGGMDGMLRSYLQSIPHYSFGGHATVSPIPTMWWRSVSASTEGFAWESFIDELAHEAGKDPLDFRKEHLPNPRYQAMIDRLDSLSGWKSRVRGAGWGVAITECFGSIVGHIVKVSRKPDGKVKIERVIALMDCGWYVNPDIISAQVEGSIVMGLGAAIKHATHFRDGKAVERNFNSYDMPRINEIPDIEVYVMENDEKPGGVGEPGLPPFAPALCNAIFDLTRKRIRNLPFRLDEV
ncbi:MAG: molybdopterin-dependent oxidoreductase [Puia sp.]|nr:molybdopterin-dependent oxidoreductase [Puia sp.]